MRKTILKFLSIMLVMSSNPAHSQLFDRQTEIKNHEDSAILCDLKTGKLADEGNTPDQLLTRVGHFISPRTKHSKTLLYSNKLSKKCTTETHKHICIHSLSRDKDGKHVKVDIKTSLLLQSPSADRLQTRIGYIGVVSIDDEPIILFDKFEAYPYSNLHLYSDSIARNEFPYWWVDFGSFMGIHKKNYYKLWCRFGNDDYMKNHPESDL